MWISGWMRRLILQSIELKIWEDGFITVNRYDFLLITFSETNYSKRDTL